MFMVNMKSNIMCSKLQISEKFGELKAPTKHKAKTDSTDAEEQASNGCVN